MTLQGISHFANKWIIQNFILIETKNHLHPIVVVHPRAHVAAFPSVQLFHLSDFKDANFARKAAWR